MTSTAPLRTVTPTAPTDTVDDPATRAFSRSMLISATRCLLTYVVFPWVLPLLGVTAGVGPALGLTIGAIAIASNVFTIRRFWISGHRWRRPITAICVSVIALLSVLVVEDLLDLFG